MSGSMRAKVRCTYVSQSKGTNGEITAEQLTFAAVARNEGYGTDGLDENNTYAKFSPSADFRIWVANPALFGKFQPNEYYYVDFAPAE